MANIVNDLTAIGNISINCELSYFLNTGPGYERIIWTRINENFHSCYSKILGKKYLRTLFSQNISETPGKRAPSSLGCAGIYKNPFHRPRNIKLLQLDFGKEHWEKCHVTLRKY